MESIKINVTKKSRRILLCGIFYYYFILFKHLFRLIQSLDYRVGIIQAQLSSLRKILDTSLLVATLGTCDTSIIIRLGKTDALIKKLSAVKGVKQVTRI